MLAPQTMALRQRRVLDYLNGLERARGSTWFELEKESDEATRLLLCHPGWVRPDIDAVRALKLGNFRGDSESDGPCGSGMVWGYECPLADEPLESDHLFPQSLGGPTLGTNHVYLCRVHNAWKSADLLAFPWELGVPAWQPEQAALVRDRLGPGARLAWRQFPK